MSNWPIGLSTGCFYQRNLLDCLEVIRSSGFSMIEVVFSPSHLNYRNLPAVREASKRVEALGMEVYSFHAPFAPEIDISSPNLARRESSLDEIYRAVEAAAILGVHYLVIHPGPEDTEAADRKDRLERLDHVVSILNRVERRCSEAGIGCVLENKLPHLLFGNINDILWIMSSLETPQPGACLDTGHAALSGDLSQLVIKLGPYVRMLHAHDNRGHADEHCPPGDGSINWTVLLRELTALHFHGVFILELASQADAELTMAGARRGRSFLRNLSRHIAMEALLKANRH
ncbi:MAG: sugar phosphate isomerase/epimerase family protein [Terrimicrobiaceae bacterium]